MQKGLKYKIITNVLIVLSIIGFYFLWKVLINKFTFGTVAIIAVALIFKFFRNIDQADNNIDIEELKQKGLSTNDIKNMVFVKRWAGVNAAGKAKFIIIDGLIFYAFSIGFLLFLSAALMFRKDVFSKDPGEVFIHIGQSLLIGAVVGTLINTIQWQLNERRFNRLNQSTEKDLLNS